MLIWPTAHRVGESERAVSQALDAVPTGIALVGVRLPGNGGREIDVLVIEPRGVTTIEAKGTRLHGAVQPSANGDWLIGGTVADFAGHATNPVGQAAAQAHRLRDLCRGHGVDIGFVPAVVVVCGNVTCDVVVVSGGVWATDLTNLPAALDGLRRGRPLTRTVVRSMLAVLGLGTRLPDDAALDAAGFARDDGSVPAPAPAALAVTAPPRTTPTYYAPPPPPAYYAPPPPRRRQRAYRPPPVAPHPMQTWPSYRAPRGGNPYAPPRRPYRRRRSPGARFLRLLMLLFAAFLVTAALGAMGEVYKATITPSPTPTRPAPVHRQTPRR